MPGLDYALVHAHYFYKSDLKLLCWISRTWTKKKQKNLLLKLLSYYIASGEFCETCKNKGHLSKEAFPYNN